MPPIENDDAVRTMLQRFVDSANVLSEMLHTPSRSADELLVCGEMRRAILALSDVLHSAGEIEENSARATDFFAASAIAAEVAAVRNPSRPSSRPGH